MRSTIVLERCDECANVQYPARGFCAHCLSPDVNVVPPGTTGELLSWTILHATLEPSLEQHLPLTIASVKLDEGPIVIAYFRGQVDRPGQSVSITSATDPAGATVFLAQPHGETTTVENIF